jgi:histidinol-phosphate aminotransferase
MTVRTRTALDTLPAYAPGRNVPGAIKLASNELSFPTLPSIAAAIADAVVHQTNGINRYPDNGAQALIAALAQHTGAPESHVIAGNGSVALCQQLVQAVAGEGDEVLFGWRSFEAYPIVTQITGATSVKVPVTPEHELDLPALAAAITPATRLVFVCTPNNPTGTAVRRADLLSFLDAVPDDVLVVIDEAYRDFDTAPDSPDGLEFALTRPNVLTLRTMSKAYGLAGLRVGYAVGDPHVVTALRKVAIPFALSSVAQAAGLAALKAKDELAPRWQQVIAERDRVTGELRDFGFEVPTSQANFIWLPLRERAAQFAAHCEAKEKVIVRAFPDAAGGVRVTIGSPAENDALLRAAAVFEQ